MTTSCARYFTKIPIFRLRKFILAQAWYFVAYLYLCNRHLEGSFSIINFFKGMLNQSITFICGYSSASNGMWTIVWFYVSLSNFIILNFFKIECNSCDWTSFVRIVALPSWDAYRVFDIIRRACFVVFWACVFS